MIEYDQRSGMCGGANLIFKLKGSVFGQVAPNASVAAGIALGLKILGLFFPALLDNATFNHPFPYSVFTFVLGFVIVFRCENAYLRFWEGRTMLELMTTKWSDAALQSVVFDNVSKKSEADRRAFRSRIISLFSLMHATALCSLREGEDHNGEPLESTMEVIEGVNKDETFLSLNSVFVRDKVFLIFSWIQDTLIRREEDGGIAVPPPICTRLFQEMSNGMLGYNNAVKIHGTPFPFPYAQLITLALIILTITMGFVVNVFVTSIFWATTGSFLAVAGYLSINEIAMELEDPFGDEDNDLPMLAYQRLYNDRLKPLLFLDEGPFRSPAIDLATAAICCSYDSEKSQPLSHQAVSQTYDSYVNALHEAGEDLGNTYHHITGTRQYIKHQVTANGEKWPKKVFRHGVGEDENNMRFEWVNQERVIPHYVSGEQQDEDDKES